jgi:hypothetical protein
MGLPFLIITMEDIYSRIPKRFKLFGSYTNIVWDNERMNRDGKYGEHDYSQQKITLSDTHGVLQLSEDKILDTFYHEKVHSILAAMNERELNDNEKFVDVFAKLLRQSDETTEYI